MSANATSYQCPTCGSDNLFYWNGTRKCLTCGWVVERPKTASSIAIMLDLARRANDLEYKLSIATEALQRIASNDQGSTPSAIALTTLERLIALGEEIKS